MRGFEALVPIKRFGDAKSRLSEALDAAARAMLMRGMASRVLRTLARVELVERVFVVTSDAGAAQMAEECGAGVIDDAGGGLNYALAAACAARRAAGASAFAIFQGDLPWITESAIASFLRRAPIMGSAVLQPDQHETGTAAIAWRAAPEMRSFAFGEESFAKHAALLADRGFLYRLCAPTRAFYDMDDADDFLLLSQERDMTLRAQETACS